MPPVFATDQSQLAERLQAASQVLGLALSAQQAERLLAYVELIKKWNKTYNITAIKDPRDILIQHIIDSLTVVKPLQELVQQDLKAYSNPALSEAAQVSTQDVSVQPLSVLDVGSGGGLPGVVLAIMNPTWHVTCIDAVHKKTAFITMVAGLLKLKNLNAVHTRIQDYPAHCADIVISRAFASLRDFVDWSGHCLKNKGMMVAMKAQYHESEMQALAHTSWQVHKYLELQVPEMQAQRSLIYLQAKKQATPQTH
ncbi:16S rRNA (guanine(527)-N(7))-methyltransferase RsmG [Brackiella oedipodis]|uniref:16S rRNA (guanine(527)-N(7))-methyltransferase RsmG n=1 Tax=Brackiella oedipodis TaxID=124225 RepID=UPI0004910B97|nr:16S rRNA (guanine(527)-N(7))-methyltransferase RsmG [Brackiella oedipodis]